MDAARWREIEDIYQSAVSRPPEARAAFLREVCRGDMDLQQRVQSLLAAGDQAEDFLELPALEDATTAQAPPIQIGSYRILHRLGAGGMGEVYRGHDAKLGRDIAIKTLATEFSGDPDRVARLRREARTLAALNHPNLATIHDLVESDGACYLVLELVEGETLRGPLPLDRALDYARQIADGLHAAHSKGIVHRDLKPANVKVTPEGRVKVLDFGLAKAVWGDSDRQRVAQLADATGSTTLAGQILGTPPYMSPEQVRGERIDERTDVWAFGCLLYELLSGKRAFDGATVPEMLASVLARDPDWSALPTTTPAKIRQLLRQCLLKDANQRPVDIQAVADVIERVIAARRDGKRLRILAAGSAAVLALAVTAGVVVSRRPAATPPAQKVRSILVIPFENQSQDPNAEYLSDGIAEGLISSLATLPDVRVIARTTAVQFKGKPVDLQQIRKQVNADAVVAGKLLSHANDIVVQADLVDVRSGNQLWGSRFHERSANALDMEQAMVERISQALRGRLTSVPAPATTNPAAYKLYLEGRFYWNKRTPQGIQKARDLFERAIAMDPQFALAYSGLADASNMLVSAKVLPRDAVFARAREAAETAVRLDPNLPDGHASLGLIYANDFVWAPAEKAFKRALALNPNHTTAMLWYSYVLLARGQLQESLDLTRQAAEIDPLSALMNSNLALRLHVIGKYSEALTYAQKATELDPVYAGGFGQMAMAYERLGQREKAVEAWERMANVPESLMNVIVVRIRVDVLRGDVTSARKRIPPLVERARRGEVLNTYVGWAYASVGDRDEAMKWLNRAFEAREPGFRNQCRAAFVSNLLTDPRYQDLLRRLARGFDE